MIEAEDAVRVTVVAAWAAGGANANEPMTRRSPSRRRRMALLPLVGTRRCRTARTAVVSPYLLHYSTAAYG
jgi:hypothetical protein